MAMFPTHIKCSTVAGIVGGTVAYIGYGVPLTTSAVGGGLCAIGGILPDIDSGPGIPLREITTFLASAVPTMLITRLLAYKLDQESLILVGAILYVGIRFGLAHFLRHYTVHRGMFHSFPSMAIFGELTYLLFYGETMFVRVFMVSAVCLGFFIHLLLDEIYSVEWDGRPRLKRSFGTAMKFAGENWWANATCYGKLIVLTYFVLIDPAVVQQIYAGQGQQVAQTLGDTVKDRLSGATAVVRAKNSGSGPLATLFGSGSTAPKAGPITAEGSPGSAPPGSAWPASAKSRPSVVPNGYPPTAPAASNSYGPVGNGPAPQPAAPAYPGRYWQ
jgi:hypothetical protein